MKSLQIPQVINMTKQVDLTFPIISQIMLTEKKIGMHKVSLVNELDNKD